jgi:hypothetical protein
MTSRPASVQEPLQALIETVYGGLVPESAAVATLLHRAWPPRLPGVVLESWRLAVPPHSALAWTVQILRPENAPAVPVLVSGDACWPLPDPDVQRRFMEGHVALAWFNRTELAADLEPGVRSGPLFDRYPQAKFGALSVWAWGLCRAVDVLSQMPGLDPLRIGVLGHSRGGKAALLAGATDPRIWLTAANNSGTAGAASSFVQGTGSETPLALAQRFGHWLGRGAEAQWRADEAWLLDQDVLIAAIAPRGLLLTQSVDDLWANPDGVRHVGARVERVYERQQAGDAFRVVWRSGPHAMQAEDWFSVLDLACRLPPRSPTGESWRG